MTKAALVARLRREVAEGRPIVGAGAGAGLSAKSAEAGGADLIMIYSSGRFRMAGRPSPAGILPFGNANQIVREMVPEILGVVKHTPVVAGLCGFDSFTIMPRLLRELQAMGIVGIQNAPTVGGLDGTLRRELEETGMGFNCEVQMIAMANQLDLLTAPYVWDLEQCQKMTQAGADILVAHVGLSTSGAVGAISSLSLDQCVTAIQQIADLAHSLNPSIMVLCHGGPIVTPDDTRYVLSRTHGVVGYIGASSIERIPVERAISGITREFKSLPVRA